jgi:hypothetical protein
MEMPLVLPKTAIAFRLGEVLINTFHQFVWSISDRAVILLIIKLALKFGPKNKPARNSV